VAITLGCKPGAFGLRGFESLPTHKISTHFSLPGAPFVWYIAGMTRYQKVLSVIFFSVWLWAAIDPTFRQTWLLENFPIFIFVPLVIIAGRYVGLSSASYTLIAVFMMLHMVGAHFTYEKVPVGYWLGDLFSSDRNMYDRFVHMCFGLLVAYPAFEALRKTVKVPKFWDHFFTFNFIMMFAAGYEIIEWLTSVKSNPDASMAYIGAQGDIWDTQIDMYVAGLGCIFTLSVVFVLMQRAIASHVSLSNSYIVIEMKQILQDLPNLQDKKVLIFGAGNTAMACIYALQALGVKDISIMNRTESKALALAEQFGIHYAKGLEILTDILINATPIGLKPVDIFPVSNEFLSRTEYVFDMVYGQTDLQTRAKKIGVKVIDRKDIPTDLPSKLL
jgi:putative membrane protein